ncbi:MAG: zinc metallopeptidase [Oscillospiraceae bacterium]|jgi:Zn-dependent membrane protease YugP|nr:zinc metallopeptidase [Oscillospiraceae bacterium]
MENLPKTLEYFLSNPNAATILLFATIIVAMLASANVRLTFSRYDKVRSARGVPAHVIARQILDSNGLYDVIVEPTRGKLTDHYDPRRNVVALSESTYNSISVSAIGIAAHECGHAIQHATAYTPIKIRTAIFPAVSIANRTWIFLVLIGFFLPLVPGTIMINVGIAAFSLAAIFQIVTLPVEFNASRRAMNTIESQGILDRSEQKGARSILNAAAMTYVAALLVSLAQLIRILAIARRR